MFIIRYNELTLQHIAMKRGYLISLLLLLVSVNTSAQLFQDLGRVLRPDSLSADSIDEEVNYDSMAIVRLYREMDSVRLSEANLRMEFEQLQLQHYKGDSLKEILQKHRIDSLRSITKGVPVIVDRDTLYYIYGKTEGISAQQRADMEAEAIKKIAKKFRVTPDSIYVSTSDDVSSVMYGKEIIASVTNQDALWAGVTRESLANRYRTAIVEKIKEMKRIHSWWELGKRILFFLLILCGQIALFKLANWLFRKSRTRIEHYGEQKLKPLSIQNFEVLDIDKQVKILTFFASMLRYALLIVLLILTVPLMFSIFPQTKKLATKLLSYIWDPVKSILMGIVHYIPNLFTIIIIWIAIHYLIKLVRYLANEIQGERLKIGGFYPDWAIPSFHIIRFFLYAFMLAMIYPYLPGSKDGVFQGISVFIGLIVSLGSSTVIGNVIAGLVITYMRSFKIGDRIKLNDTMGNVIEKTPLVIRIRTPKNEVVTLPNSFMMSSQTVNYSRSAREFGLIIHSEVTIGYDAPWREVHEMLINSALNTPGVLEDPKPFVLETSLNDFYPVYQINAYIRDADHMTQIYSDLHQNIQDIFNKNGVEILSPHYRANRDGNETTIPKNEMRTNFPQYDEAMAERRVEENKRNEDIVKKEAEFEDKPEGFFSHYDMRNDSANSLNSDTQDASAAPSTPPPVVQQQSAEAPDAAAPAAEPTKPEQ